MVRTVACAFITVALLGCAQQPRKPRPPHDPDFAAKIMPSLAADREEALRNLGVCFDRAAPAADDRISDARTIAQTLVVLCSAEAQALLIAEQATKGASAGRLLAERWRSIVTDLALPFVIQSRQRAMRPPVPAAKGDNAI